MKKTGLIVLFLLLSSFLGTSSATEVTIFGPKQYWRISGAPDVYGGDGGVGNIAELLNLLFFLDSVIISNRNKIG